MMQGANYGVAPKSIGIGPPPFDPATHLRTFDPTTINARAPVVSTPPPPESERLAGRVLILALRYHDDEAGRHLLCPMQRSWQMVRTRPERTPA